MNKFLIFAASLPALFGGLSAVAQSPALATANYPGGVPIAARAPDFSSWVISCKYTGVQPEAQLNAGYQASIDRAVKDNPEMGKVYAANPSIAKRKPRLMEIAVTRTGKIKRTLTAYTNGQVNTRWVTADGTVSLDAFTDKMSLELLGENEESDFLELSWVSKDNFAGTEIIQNRPCLVYKATIERLRIDDPLAYQQFGSEIPSERVVATVLVDLATRLPVRLQYAEQTREYDFQSPPREPLSVPPEFAAAIQSGQRQLKGSGTAISRP